MPSQVITSVENNFTKGLITEFTGLNFPENAAIDTENCLYTIVGDVTRRAGINYETNFAVSTVDRTNKAVTSYKWNNAGGDGETQIVVKQIGSTLYFYSSSAATIASPLSANLLLATVDVSSFVVFGSAFDPSKECQYSDGNGYLFVFHPSSDPFYCTYDPTVPTNPVITASVITVKIRDFAGVPEVGISAKTRPLTLTPEHNYNLINQGWSSGNAYNIYSHTPDIPAFGTHFFQIGAGLASTVHVGDQIQLVGDPPGGGVSFPFTTLAMLAIVTAYDNVSGVLTFNCTYVYPASSGISFFSWLVVQVNIGHVNDWKAVIGNYPSSSDVWWYFKNTAGVFDPANTIGNTTLSTGPAPKGSIILNAFNQTRTLATGVTGITDVNTFVRPKTGTWFQGRVWLAGVDDTQQTAGDQQTYSWTENIYFSQIVVTPDQFGNCYQTNDPTSENLFDLLPTDGGVIKIQGSGSIYKLFPLLNALIIFAANGVWYLTGSSGVGFSANDYTIVKLSAVKSISGSSFVDVNGLPMFWNEEGIYSVEPAKQGTGLLNSPLHVQPLEVNPITVGTILTFYNNIPLQSKQYVRGVYDPINYVVQWIYKSANEVSVTDRYSYDSILNFNTFNKAFYPYTLDISGGKPSINGIVYVSSPGGSAAPNSVTKFIVSKGTSNTFGEEFDTNYVDWASSGTPVNFLSFFTTGYKLHGQGQRRFQLSYLYTFSRADTPTAYKVQGLWDYATTANSGRWSVAQIVNNWTPNFGMVFRRHKIRGQGLVLQLKISSVDGMPFDIMGWSTFESQNAGV